MRTERTRGQPLLVLAVILSGWIGVRALAWTLLPDSPQVVLAQRLANPEPPAAAEQQVAAPAGLPATVDAARLRQPATPSAPPAVWHPPLPRESISAPPHAPVLAPIPALIPQPAPPSPLPQAQPLAAAAPTEAGRWIMVAGGHQLLALAATAMLPMPADIAGRFAAAPAAPSGRARSLPRWSGDAWLFLRGGSGAPVTFPRLTGGGTYGASQAGAVLRYRLAPADPHRPTVYLRAAGALGATREQELGLGLSARPLAGVPVAVMAEARLTRDAQGIHTRPAVALVTELPPRRLPLGFSGEAYVQGGYVGGPGATAFVDGLARAERPVADVNGFDLRAGAGAWGARQRGASRVDIGPVASVRVRLGDTASARIEADWRFRVAGGASPGSGPALTISTGF